MYVYSICILYLEFYVTESCVKLCTYYNTNFVYGFVVPDKVTGVDLLCFPVNMIIECNAEWDVSTLMCICIMYAKQKQLWAVKKGAAN